MSWSADSVGRQREQAEAGGTGLPRHYAAYHGHRTVTVRETVMMDALTRFFTERVFGPDRAAMLAAQMPATAAAEQRRRTYNRDKHQVTIHATITGATPKPSATCEPNPARTTTPHQHQTPARAPQDPVSHLTSDTGSPPGPAQPGERRYYRRAPPPGRRGGLRGVAPRASTSPVS